NVGKTCLFYRLQGDKFHEEYVASEEIKVASIQWNYNATDDVVKVEIWDVVDKGKKREILSTQIQSSKDVLKMHNNNNQNDHTTNIDQLSSPALDAEFVDVYKGTNGVIFLFDMTKAWTFDYIQREIHQCPLHIPILILANHRDMGHHRVLTGDQVQGFIETIIQEDLECNRKRTGQIRYAECSMRNGFGLRYLYKFFNLPYLHLQRETMLKQLERNRSEIDATCQELDAMIDSDDHNYDNFLQMLTDKRRMMADQLSATKKNVDMIPSRSVSMPANMSTMANGDSQNHQTRNNQNNNEPIIVKPMPSIIIGANNPLPPKFQQQFQKNKPNKSQTTITTTPNNASVKNIEDFIPDDGEQNIFRKFLDEPNLPHQTDLPPVIDEEDSDDAESTGNKQIVAKYQEELDPEDLIAMESNNISNKIESIEHLEVKKVENEINPDPDPDDD
ncbi:Ras-like protein, partial [Euroglyphus maynei]